MYRFSCFLGLILAMGWGLMAAPSTPYGICAHVTRQQESATKVEAFKLMRAAGIQWVRSDFDWHNVEPQAGEWKFEHLDQVLDEAEKAQIQLLPILAYGNHFANPVHKHLPQWTRYVRTVVERYKDRIPIWEVWNEQNIPSFWENPNVADYLVLLKATYQEIKAIDPKLKVMIGGFAGVPLDYIEGLYQAGGKDFFDIMNVHPYCHPAMPEGRVDSELRDLHKLMARYQDQAKPVWITELGWPTQKRQFSAPGLIKKGLEIARPNKKDKWRIAVLDDPAFSTTSAPANELLLPELPANVTVERLTLNALLSTLANYAVDAVVLPFDETFPATGFDQLYAYVKQGGILIECGGAPFYYAYQQAADGTWSRDDNFRRPDLRVAMEAWWHDEARIPRKMPVVFGEAAKELKMPPRGLHGERFLKPTNLQGKDQFIPLVVGEQDGYQGTTAAVLKYDSDLKGALIISALFERGHFGASEVQQAQILTRATLLSLHHDVERFFWYEFQAPEYDDFDQESHFGITHKDFALKPGYTAYQQLTQQRPAGSRKLQNEWEQPEHALYFPQWQAPDDTVGGAIWTTKEPGLYKLTFSANTATMCDYMGRAMQPGWQPEHTCVLSVSASPIYFKGATLLGIEPAPSNATTLTALIPENFAVAQEQYRGMLQRMQGTKDQFPRRWENQRLVTIPPREWTSGFFPGSLWYLYEYSKEESWREAALHYTAMLEQIRHYTGNHDIGFMLYCSFGNGLRLAKPEGYHEVLQDGAAALCKRYIPRLGMIRSWDHGAYLNPVIIDNMMNLELLMWAAKNGGREEFREIAMSHADQTDRRHYRADGSAFHIVDLDPLSCKIRGYHAGQGASADAPWARGQSWGLYGFTMMYRETGKKAYLERACKAADYLINHPSLPADKVPYWDYDAAEIPYAPRDSSAGAIMASALLELSTYVEGARAQLYRTTAIEQLVSLSSPAYLAARGSNGNFLLRHGVGHLPGNVEIDVPLNYADYYFLEALLRFQRLPNLGLTPNAVRN